MPQESSERFKALESLKLSSVISKFSDWIFEYSIDLEWTQIYQKQSFES